MDVENADKEEIIRKAARFICPGRVKVFGEVGLDLVVGKREGPFMWDLGGHRLIDVHLNGGVFNLGHRNPEVMAALKEAMESLDIGNHHLVSGARTLLAERLAELTPGDLRYTVYSSGGGEAVDVAIKTARYATGRRRVVSYEKGYHGRTGLSGIVGNPSTAEFFLSDAPADEHIRVPFNDLDAMEKALSGNDVAAVILETIPATAGFLMPEKGYLPGVKALCQKHGALFIADEVQTGLGRTGHMWAIEAYGVVPDILVTGKGLSGGVYPISATVISESAAGWLHQDGWAHVSTFGGAELGCAVAMKVLEITGSGVLENVREMSEYFGRGLAEVQARNPFLKEIRRNGLVMALKFDHEMGGLLMARSLYENGVWAYIAGFDYSVIQFKPYLLVDRALADEILERLQKAIDAISRSVTGA